MEIPLKSRNKPPYDPAIQLLGIYPEETKTEKDTCTPVFIAGTDAEAETPVLWPPDAKNRLIGKDPDAGRY